MLEWNVYFGNFNRQCIETVNILGHSGTVKEIAEAYKKSGDNRAVFEDEVRRVLHYYYWCKCEWEIILSGWPPSDRFKDAKVDVYSQIELNWDRFMDYLWDHRYELA